MGGLTEILKQNAKYKLPKLKGTAVPKFNVPKLKAPDLPKYQAPAKDMVAPENETLKIFGSRTPLTSENESFSSTVKSNLKNMSFGAKGIKQPIHPSSPTNYKTVANVDTNGDTITKVVTDKPYTPNAGYTARSRQSDPIFKASFIIDSIFEKNNKEM